MCFVVEITNGTNCWHVFSGVSYSELGLMVCAVHKKYSLSLLNFKVSGCNQFILATFK